MRLWFDRRIAQSPQVYRPGGCLLDTSNEEKIFSLNKDETITKKTTVDGELTVGKTKFVPMATASEGLNIVILD